MENENANTEAQTPEERPKRSQRDLVFDLVSRVSAASGRERPTDTHVKDFLTKDEKKAIRGAIFDLIQSGDMSYKKDRSDAPKVRKYASCLLCDAFKKDSRYN